MFFFHNGALDREQICPSSKNRSGFKNSILKKVPGVRYSFKKDETVFSKSGKNEKVFSVCFRLFLFYLSTYSSPYNIEWTIYFYLNFLMISFTLSISFWWFLHFFNFFFPRYRFVYLCFHTVCCLCTLPTCRLFWDRHISTLLNAATRYWH